MPNIEVRGKYRTFRYDGDAPLDFTTYNNLLCVIRRPNINTFVTLQQYVPGQGGAFTTFQPGSSYTIVTRADGTQGNFNFDMGTYTRVDRLPASTFLKSPNFYIGLDKNSIAVPISSYALSVNSPLSSVVNIVYVNGQGNRLQYVYADNFKTGAPLNFTHFLPNSGYELRNRIPFTFFAPLQSEMGDAFAMGNNDAGEYGMGYRHSNNSFPGDNIYGNWDKIVFNNEFQTVTWNGQTFNAQSLAALSSHGNSKALFVLGSNLYGQLGTGSSQQYYPVWTRVAGTWLDIAMGTKHMLATNTLGHLYACGDNTYGQLGVGAGIIFKNTLTLVNSTRTHVELAAYLYSSMVRTSTGGLYGFGSNSGGRLGVGNTTSVIYTPTQEILGYAWTSVKANPAANYFVAISNKKLYGRAAFGNDTYYYGNVTNSPPVDYAFTQEDLNLTDVTDVKTTLYGTHIQRENQDRYFVAGFNSQINNNRLASLTGSVQFNELSYFTRSLIPSDAQAIASYFDSTYNISYIKNNIRYSKKGGSVFTQNDNNYYNMFINMLDGKSTCFTLRGIAPTPSPTITPTITPTRTPTPTPAIIFKTQGFFTGNWPHSTQASTADNVRDGGISNSGWSTSILFNEPAGRTDCNSQVYNNYSSILQYDYGANSTNPAQSTRVYRHYSNRTFESAQMEPQSFGGRICYVFNGYSSGPGNNIIDSSKLCFQYFSQNFPRASYCSMIDGTNPVGYLQPIYSKMAPNPGTFQDNRNSKQRIEIDSSNIGNSSMTDFYINPVNNSYHVLYHKKVDPSSPSNFQYYFYYTNSYNRGVTWSTPVLVDNGVQTNLSYSRGGPYLDQLFCGRGWPLDHLVILDTQSGTSNTPKPVALYSTTGGTFNTYSLRCSYTINSPFDASVALVTNTSTTDTVNFHGDIGNLKLLTDQANSLIAMYCGADTPPSPRDRWVAGDGTEGGGPYGTPYTGAAPCRIYYRYCNLNSFQWSAQREIGKTFPRVGGFPYLPSVNPPGRGFLGRIYDACIDTSDNTLCIVYTPTVDRNTVSSARWSFCAWKLYVKKVNIYTNTTIFDELVYDITNQATSGTSYVKTITVSNIIYDTQRASLVVCAHTAAPATGAGVTLQRVGANSWNNIGNGPFGGATGVARRLKLITQKYV